MSMERIGGVLDRLLKNLGLEGQLQGWRVVEQWGNLVGPRLARKTRAVAFQDGTLRVEVEGSAWMQELGFLKRELIKTINRELGSNPVRDIRFVVPRGGILR